MNKTVDFGAPPEFGMHHFYVEIPAAPRDAVVIYEDYGFDGEDSRRETVECRLILARELWTKIRDDVRRDFNARLKIKKQGSGTWSTGKVKLDRFLGRELCVLGWAAEHASPDECLVICQKWLALRPEERWWLYSKTAAEAGRDDQTQRGWRKALYCALSDGANIKLETKKKPKSKKLQVEDETQDLFGFMEKGEF
ncbi:Protein of uncharacterised function (DUF3780) [Enterobacter hormaechei]|jgi:hypothetical protein|uniref:anti-phage-associated DUF3780 domain-containing protein n=1 Tax=Enterobacteriaceae TaxID=543 RepID=UPI000537E9AC|nr:MULTISPECIES: anti-phage-associated DUF3780 domain-containing protein [Enterobacteriaceae]EKW5657526.1 DUF3780 domain-containing protein [Citrobacter koseri]EKW5657856.1 DUF3780 domain-containing protein [Citrobacter koseri]EKX8767067.1 DUF3780 domain-containing protein [Citrobacter koseri]EKX8769006.1 DUF3780 domain-containing protein [Citrobacter koseri]ELJ2665331.1 DUF3780 domain-containing protein [Citrobacter koseri]